MTSLPPVRRFVASTGVRIFRIPCNVLPGLSARVFLLLGAGPPTLVDTGSGLGDSTSQILAGFDVVRCEFGEPVRPADVQRILITHAHLDHFGGLAALAALTHARVGAHPLSCRTITAYDERAVLMGHLLEHFLRTAGVESSRRRTLIDAFGFLPGRIASVPVDFLLEDGRELDGLRFLHTPGHASGHVCIQVGDVLLAGDHILARTVSQQWPECLGPCTGLAHYLDSLAKLERVEGLALALPAHEPPIQNIAQRIEEIRASHFRRLDRLMAILDASPQGLTVDEATQRMYSHQAGFAAMLALTDVGARIEYLDQLGRLAIANLDEVRKADPPVLRFRPAEGGRA